MNNTLKKIIAALAILVAVALIVVPGVIGASIESSTASNLTKLVPTQILEQITIEQTNFDSSWFSSTARFELAVNTIEQQDLTLMLDLKISHGPLLFTSQGVRLGMAFADISPNLDNIANITLPLELPNFNFYLLAGFFQSLESGVSVGNIEYGEDTAHFLLEGMEASVALAANQSADMRFEMGELEIEISDDNVAMRIPGISATSRTENFLNIAAISEANIVIPSIIMDSPTPGRVGGVRIESHVAPSQTGINQLDIYQRLAVDSIESEFPFNSINWVFEVNEINSTIFEGYSQLLGDMQSFAASNNAADPSQLNQIGQELALLLVQNSLEFKNLLEANIYDGNHQLDLSISWQGLPDLTSFSELDINALINALTVHVALSLNESATMQSPLADFVTNYVNQGFLQIDNGSIELLASLQSGNLIVNDESLPIDQFF